MKNGGNQRLVARFQRFAILAGLISVGAGGLVLAGWMFTNLFSGDLQAVKTSTASGFVLSGISLSLLTRPQIHNHARWIAFGCASLTILLGTLILCQHLLNLNLFLDQLLVQNSYGPSSYASGRMSVITALNFALLGSALLLLGMDRAHLLSQSLGLVVAAISLVAAVGYVYDIEILHRVGSTIHIAPSTAHIFLLVSCGVVAARPTQGVTAILVSDNLGSQLARRMLPSAILIPLLLGWVRLRGQQAGYYGTEFGLAVFACCNVSLFVALICGNAWMLNKADIEHRKAEAELRQTRDDLESRVQLRTLELSRTNDTLQETRAWQRSILQSADVSVISTDEAGIIQTFNQGAEKLLGYRSDEVVGQLTPDVFHDPEELAQRAAELSVRLGRLVPPGKEVFTARLLLRETNAHEWCYIRKDGSRVPVLLSVTCLRDDRGETIGFLGVGIDVSARIAAELALRQLNEELEDRVRQRTADLEAINARLQLSDLAINSASVATCWMTPDGQITRTNQACTDLLGFSEAELLHMKIFDLMRDSPYEGDWGCFMVRLRQEKCLTSGITMRRKDGGTFPADFDINLFGFDGQEHLFGYIRDLSEQNRAEAAIREGEARLLGIVNSAMDAIITIDSEQNIVLFTPAAERLFGYSQAEMLGQTVDRLLPERFRPMHQGQIQGFSRTGMTTRKMGALGIVSGLKKNGEEFPAEASISQIEVGDQKLFTAILRDITDRMQAESSLRESEERFRLLVDGIQDHALVMLSPEGLVVSWNPGAERIQGYPSEEIIGRHFSLFYAPEDIEQGKPNRNLETTVREGRYEDEGWRVRRDGTRFWAHLIYTSLLDKSGNLRGFVKITRDITGLKQAELELRAKNEEIQTMSQQLWQTTKLATMGELAAGIAHELNNPLATVNLRLESILARTPEDDPKRRSLEIVEQEIDRITRLVSNLLQFSRRSGPQISTVSVQAEIDGTLELIHYQLRNRNISLNCDFDPEMPRIQGDSQRLRQLFLNLFTNASDAMPQGGVLTIRVRSSTEFSDPSTTAIGLISADHSWVTIEIIDTGVGIAPENFPRIFESFYTTKPEGKGTGLGLPICKRIVEEHGGSFHIDSELGTGTTVTIILPVTFTPKRNRAMGTVNISSAAGETDDS